MTLAERTLKIRQEVGRFLTACFRPNLLKIEKARAELNLSLKDHWKPHSIEVHELIWETWEADKTSPSSDETNHFIVFIDAELDIDWITKKDLEPAAAKSVSYAESIGARRCKHLPLNQILEFRRLIGHAIVNAIRSDKSQATELSNRAAQFLQDRTIERSRIWTLTYSHVLMAIFTLAILWLHNCCLMPSSGFPVQTPFFLLAVQGGIFGAYLSILQNAGKGKWDAASGPGLHRLEVLTKIVVGGLLGGVALALTRSSHSPPSLKEITPDESSTFVFGFIAGLFERTIPKMISSYSQEDKPSDKSKE